MANWFIMNIQTGCIKSEWSQDKTDLNKIKNVHKNIDGSSTTFAMNYIQSKGKNINPLRLVGKRSRYIPSLISPDASKRITAIVRRLPSQKVSQTLNSIL